MTSSVLHDALRATHEELSSRLDVARSMMYLRDHSSRGYPPIDLFLAVASKHMHAVDAVLLPAVRRACRDDHALIHDYLRPTKELEVVLAHVKAHEYGSTYETQFDWEAVWGDVDAALEDQWRQEQRIADRLETELDDGGLDALAEALVKAEERAPTRPHPYLPHTGPFGRFARGVMRVADAFWDSVEGRFVPERARKPDKKPGLIGQYFLGDTRFPEEEETEAGRQDAGLD